MYSIKIFNTSKVTKDHSIIANKGSTYLLVVQIL